MKKTYFKLKDVFNKYKTTYLLGKLIYLALYVFYLYFLVAYRYTDSILLSSMLVASICVWFVVAVVTTIIEYYFTKKERIAKRIYVLKAVRSSLKVVVLTLTIAVVIEGIYVRNSYIIIYSAIMTVFHLINIVTDFYGIYKIKHGASQSEVEEYKYRKHQETTDADETKQTQKQTS